MSYDGPPRAPNRTVFYGKDTSRITGELSVLHVEWKINGLKAVRRAGID